jgi:hypothetical protein
MTYSVALPLIPVEGGLAPGEAVECPSGSHRDPARACGGSRRGIRGRRRLLAWRQKESAVSLSLNLERAV